MLSPSHFYDYLVKKKQLETDREIRAKLELVDWVEAGSG